MTTSTGSSGSEARTSASASRSEVAQGGAAPRSAALAFAALAAALWGACASKGSGTLVPDPRATDDPYVLILGTAQDGGLPHAACTCPRCTAARSDPTRARRIASLAIVVPSTGHRYLVDATPDLRAQLDALPWMGHPRGGVDRAPVDGVLLTHAHAGHYTGLAFFGYEAVHARGLPVYATPRMAAFLRANGPWSRMVAREEIAVREMPPGTPVELDAGVRVTPFAVPHRDEDSDTVGFQIEGPRAAIVYVPDTDGWSAWSPPLRERLARCRVALLDGTFFAADELPGRDVTKIGHPLMVTTMELLGEDVRAGRYQVLFTHLNHSNRALEPDGPERRALREAGFGIASDGQRIPL